MGTTVRDQLDPEAEERRGRFAGLLRTGAGTVGLLIAIVLVAQAGLVYVAVDQIGTGDETTIVPARNAASPRAPISVDAEQRERAPAPAATRTVVEVEDSEGPPDETGLDLAGERAEPSGVAPPLTGNEPPADGRDEAQPADEADEPEAESPGASEQAASESPSEAPASEDASTAPPSEEESGEESEEQAEDEGDQGPGASGGEPPGHGGDNPGNGSGNGNGDGKGNG